MPIIKHNNAPKAVESHPRGLDYKPTVVGANFVVMIKPDFKLGKLTFIKRLPVIKTKAPHTKLGWKYEYKDLYRCFCGKEFATNKWRVEKGHTKSCGCYRDFKISLVKHSHGEWGTRLNFIWASMKRRCNNPNEVGYANYGGRGIKVCEEWETFEPFRNWALANGYEEHLTIDRKNTNGNYEPENCQWVPHKLQNINQRKRKDNKTGYTGVELTDSGRFQATITIDKQKTYLGTFDDIEVAVIMYELMKEERNNKYFNEFKNKRS